MSEMFGRCGCGGRLFQDGHEHARMRCPECRSDDVTRGDIEVMFD
jgi:hypothetical protein